MDLLSRSRIQVLKWLLGDQKIYDVASAIRGCDSGNWCLKLVFSARFRALLGCDRTLYTGAVRTHKRIAKSILKCALDKLSMSDVHYLVHMLRAINAFYELELIDGRESYVLTEFAKICAKLLTHEIEYKEAVEMLDKLAKEYDDIIIS